MEGRGLQLGVCLSPPSSGYFVSQRAVSILWDHVTSVRRHESDSQSVAGPCGANKLFIESRQKPEGFDICSRSDGCRWLCFRVGACAS